MKVNEKINIVLICQYLSFLILLENQITMYLLFIQLYYLVVYKINPKVAHIDKYCLLIIY
jgi:hypothetical protein